MEGAIAAPRTAPKRVTGWLAASTLTSPVPGSGKLSRCSALRSEHRLVADALTRNPEAQNDGRGGGPRKVAAFLNTHPKVASVWYLGFLPEGHPDRPVFERQCKGPGSTFSFEVRGGEAEAFAVLDRLNPDFS